MATQTTPSEPTTEAKPDVLTIAPKQAEGMAVCREKKFVLYSGPRYSSKTVGAQAVICDHAWRTKGAQIAVITVSQSIGLESGVWQQLVEEIIPRYMNLGQGMVWVKKPFVASVSKKPTCIVSNMHGGQSMIRLESLKDEGEVEARFKNKSYTMMYVTELSNFKYRKTFDIWAESLRSLHLKDNEYLFLADTNPADDGDESWIYHIWYIHAKQSYAEYCDFQAERGLPVLPEEDFMIFRNSLGLVEFEIADNIYASKHRISELTARYAHDKDLYDRYIRGLWVKASVNSLFARQFKPNIHVIGEAETPGNPEPEILIPSDSTWELVASWDPGSSANSAATLFEKLFIDGQKSIYNAIDEVVIVDTEHTVEEFTLKVLARMEWWENFLGRKLSWRHWSDRSVFDMKEPQGNRYYHQLIHSASGGRITLQASDRSGGSVKHRVDLMRRLLFENRFFASRALCPNLVQMLKSIPSNKNDLDTPPRKNKHKHVFDALTYGISSESYDEVSLELMKLYRKTRENNESKLASIPI